MPTTGSDPGEYQIMNTFTLYIIYLAFYPEYLPSYTLVLILNISTVASSSEPATPLVSRNCHFGWNSFISVGVSGENDLKIVMFTYCIKSKCICVCLNASKHYLC